LIDVGVGLIFRVVQNWGCRH